MTRGLKVFVAHDEPYLASVFADIERSAGSWSRRIVRRNGRAIGWYAYLPNTDRPSQALHICAARGEIGAVFDDLVRSARREAPWPSPAGSSPTSSACCASASRSSASPASR